MGDLKYLLLIFTVHTISLKIALFSLSPGACLREAASAKAGERAGVRGDIRLHPTSILPRQGGGELLVIFMVRGCPPDRGYYGLLSKSFPENRSYDFFSPNKPLSRIKRPISPAAVYLPSIKACCPSISLLAMASQTSEGVLMVRFEEFAFPS